MKRPRRMRALRLLLSMFVLCSVTPASAKPFAYVWGWYSVTIGSQGRAAGYLDVIDTDTNTVVMQQLLDPPLDLVTDVKFSPDGALAYVHVERETEGSYLEVLDTDTNAVLKTLPLYPPGNGGIAVTADGYLYLLTTSSQRWAYLSVADLTDGAQLRNIVLSREHGVNDIALTPDGRFIYAVSSTYRNGTHKNDVLYVVSTDDSAVVATLEGGGRQIAFSPDGSRAYVTDSETLHIISTEQRRIVGDVRIGRDPWGVTVSPDGSRAYVADIGDRAKPWDNVSGDMGLWVVDLEGLTSTHVFLEGRTANVALTPDGERAYVANWSKGVVHVIDTATLDVAATIPVTGEAWGIAIPPGQGPTSGPCVGDCDGNGEVTVNELVTAVGIALGTKSMYDCVACDGNSDGEVGIDELLKSVNAALSGCR